MPPPETLIDLAMVAIGAVLGALVFSVVVGRYRARQLARLADRLAGRNGEPPAPGSIRYPDRVLRRSLQALAGHIAEVEAMATTDMLTGVMNRQACLHVLTAEVERVGRYGRPLSVALFDIDHFKRVNDAYGHAAGDELLRHVAGLLRSNVRAVDSLGRFGGEEFLLIMPETDVDAAAAAAENLRRVVGRSKFVLESGALEVTVSAGIAGGAGSVRLEIDTLLRAADTAMYTAKALGRDQVQVFRAVDEEAEVPRAPITPAARTQALQLGRAAFDAAHEQLRQTIADRPGWAGGPSQLIADLASGMARAVGLPDGDIERIRTASLLHDLGMVAISDDILAKPTTLTRREWRAVVEHPKIGQVILERAGAIRDAAAIVLHHHEWFNGRGYPHGLAGLEIPVGARILAIAEAYEAMIVGRPYKQPMSHDEAIAELLRNGGDQFDPELVELFVTLYGSGLPARRLRGNGHARLPAAYGRVRNTGPTVAETRTSADRSSKR